MGGSAISWAVMNAGHLQLTPEYSDVKTGFFP